MTKKIALFFDSDNISYRFIKPILHECNQYGTINIRRAYADWSMDQRQNWKKQSLQNAIELVQASYMNNYKNSSDIKIIIDIMDVLYTDPNITTFILVSNDTDFSSLFPIIKKNNKELIFIGDGSGKSSVLRTSCDIYVDCKSLVENYNLINETTAPVQSRKQTPVQKRKKTSTKQSVPTKESLEGLTKIEKDLYNLFMNDPSQLINMGTIKAILVRNHNAKIDKTMTLYIQSTLPHLLIVERDCCRLKTTNVNEIIQNRNNIVKIKNTLKDHNDTYVKACKKKITEYFATGTEKSVNPSEIRRILEGTKELKKQLNKHIKQSNVTGKSKFKNYILKYYGELLIFGIDECCYIGNKNNSIEDEIDECCYIRNKNNSIEDEIDELIHTPISQVTTENITNIKRKLDEQIKQLKEQIEKKFKS
jgi:uncharacterized protein (TIGR00288 family)